MRSFVGMAFICCLTGCGHDDQAASKSADLPTIAETSDIHFESAEMGVNPFIYQINLSGQRLPAVKTLSCVIEPKPGSVSKPVRVTYSLDALTQRGKFPDHLHLQVPLFGLYPGYTNQISISIGFADHSTQDIAVAVKTAEYVDPTGIYTRPTFVKKRAPGQALGFDFIAVKSNLLPLVIIDTDGELRWVGAGPPTGAESALDGNSFLVGDRSSNVVHRIDLDGTVTSFALATSTYLHFHHNIDHGRTGFLGEFDTASNVESTVAEFDGEGSILMEWDLARIFSDYMAAHGDDPTPFVRPGFDWFHNNATTYDPRDDSLLVSSRENFIVKLDYDTREIRWLFGDSTKYWGTFPSLQAKALTLEPGGLYPIGQHAISISRDGLLMMFNNGYQSVKQPVGAPVGASRSYSAVTAYRVDDASLTAKEEWRFDYDRSISSLVCSSAYEAADRSLLVDYAWADNATHARLVGLDPGHQVVFDFQYENDVTGCHSSWNAVPIGLENVSYQ